jgi:hypothetical protein
VLGCSESSDMAREGIAEQVPQRQRELPVSQGISQRTTLGSGTDLLAMAVTIASDCKRSVLRFTSPLNHKSRLKRLSTLEKPLKQSLSESNVKVKILLCYSILI